MFEAVRVLAAVYGLLVAMCCVMTVSHGGNIRDDWPMVLGAPLAMMVVLAFVFGVPSAIYYGLGVLAR